MSGKIISLQEANERKETFRKKTLAKDELYVESEFYSAEALKKLVGNTPLDQISGLRISFAQIGREGKSALTTVVEVVLKEEKKSASRLNETNAAEPDSVCPYDCK